MDLKELLAELKERRWRTAHYVGGPHHDERIAELAMLQTAIRAVEDVIEEGRGEPEPLDFSVMII